MTVKPLISFFKNKDGLFGRHSVCKECYSKKMKNNYKLSEDQIIAKKEYEKNKQETKMKNKKLYLKKWSEKNKEKKYLLGKKYRKNNKEYIKQSLKKYHKENKEKIAQKRKEKYEKVKHTEEFKRKNREYVNYKNKTDIVFKIKCVLRSRVRHAIKNNIKKCTKKAGTFDLLGISAEEARKYLENMFLPGMSWENYGKGHGKWNIDHIIPCASFDLIDLEQQKKCFHYTNIQPLWEDDWYDENGILQPGNRSKGDKIIPKPESTTLLNDDKPLNPH
jgi:hypothetical protein